MQRQWVSMLWWREMHSNIVVLWRHTRLYVSINCILSWRFLPFLHAMYRNVKRWIRRATSEEIQHIIRSGYDVLPWAVGTFHLCFTAETCVATRTYMYWWEIHGVNGKFISICRSITVQRVIYFAAVLGGLNTLLLNETWLDSTLAYQKYGMTIHQWLGDESA